MRRFLLFALAAAVLPLTLFAQTGLPPFGSIDQIGLEYRNNQDLNVLVSIPVVSSPGRNGLNLNFSLVYNSSIWTNCYGTWSLYCGSNTPGGWTTGYSTGQTTYKYATRQTICDRNLGDVTYIYTTTYSNYQYVDPLGTPHPLPLFWQQVENDCTNQFTTTGTFSGYATDGSGYLGTISESYPQNPGVLSKGGISLATTGMTDTNGNYISSTTNGSETDWTDSVGRLALKTVYGTLATTYSYLDPTGGYQTATLNLQTLNIKTNFGCSGVTEYTGPASVPSSLSLPDGRTYTFSYEPSPGNSGYYTGRLQRVTLPTGGYYEYDYTGANDGINCADGTTLSMNRVVNDGTTSKTWNYVRNTSSLTTTVTTPQLADTSSANDMVVTFNSSGQEIARKIYRNSPGTGTPLRTINTTWASNGTPATKVTILDDGTTQSKVATTYDSNGLPDSVSEYNFGSGAPGSLLRTTAYTYQTSTNYTSRNILNLVNSKQIKDGSGNIRYTQLIDYDGVALQNCATGAPQHNDAGYPCSLNYRGNPTSVTPANGTTSENLTYDWFGNLLTATDALGHPITISYSDSWADSTCPPASNTYAYPTSISNALSQTTTIKYYACVGLVSSVTDPNNQTTSTTYDLYKRPSQENFPDGGQTTWSYNGVTSVTATTKMNSSQNIVSTVLLDALGRTSQTQLNSDPEGVDYTATLYDHLGRPYQVYNPTRCSPPTTDCGESTWGYSTSAYDALGRTTSVTLQDGSVTSATYSANTSTVTDPAGKKRATTSDSAGHLTQVTEDPAGLGYVTTYSYDALDNLMSVLQNGSRQRSFVYDSLSRLVCESNPEIQIATCPYPDNGSYTTGTIRYSYDNDYNITSKQSPAPNQTGSSTVTATYSYDTLNRLTQKSYSDGTTTSAFFAYDGSGWWGITQTNVVGRLMEAWNGTSCCSVGGAQIFSYDPMGRVTLDNQCDPAECPSGGAPISYTYDFAGNLLTSTNGVGITFSQAFDTAARAIQLTSSLVDSQHPATLATTDSSVGYYPHGAVSKMTFGNGLTTANLYEPRLTPCVTNVNSSGSGPTSFGGCTGVNNLPPGTVQQYGFAYGAWGTTNNDNVTTMDAAGQQNFNRSYSYDSLNRLSTLSSPSDPNGCTGLSWTYDAWGNRTDQTVTGGTCPSFHQPVNTQNRLINSPFAYDAAGNLTADASHTYFYDAENRLVQVDGTLGTCSTATACYLYDAFGRRTEKIVGSTKFDYLYDLSGNVVTDWCTNCGGYTGALTEYVSLSGHLVAEYTNGTTYFVHQDHLGSTRLVTGVGSDLISNPGFEQGEADWVDWDSNYVQLVDNPSLAHSGNYYAQLSWSGTGGPSVISQTLAVQPGDQLSFGGWVNLQSGGGGSLGWLIETQDANHNALNWINAGASPTTSGWQFQTADYIVPAGVAYVFLYATVWDPSSATVLLVDDGFLYDNRTSVQIVQNLDYLPYGELNSSDSGTTTHKFTGDERDSETSLDHTQFRQYSSSYARWMTPDPAGLAAVDPSNPQTWNRYAYVRNMPLALIDPLGTCPPVVQNRNPDQNQSQDSQPGGGPYLADFADPTAPDPPAQVGNQGSCQQAPWYYGGGGGGWFSLDGGYNSDDSGFGVGFPAGASGGIGGAIFLITTSEVPNPDWFKNNCMEWDSDCGNMPLWVESQQIQILADPFGPGAGSGGTVAKPRLGGFNPNKVNSCFAKGLKETGLSIGLDVVGAIPALGNMVSASAATAHGIDDVVAYGGGTAGVATSLSDENPFGTLSASGGLGLALADMSLGGTKAIPIVGNVLSGATGIYDVYRFNQVVQACIAAP